MRYLDELADLRAKVRSMRLTFAHLPGVLVGLYRTDGYCILMEGVRPAEVVAVEGKHFDEFLVPARRERFLWLFNRALAGEETTTDYPISDGVLLQAIVKPIRDERGEIRHILFFCRDITAERASRGARDSLTGLAKRDLFNAHIAAMLRRGFPFALLFIDLDGFKGVNDSQGHRVGDIVLERVAKEIQSAIRTGDLGSRLGGDEFAIVLADPGQPLVVGRRILARIIAVTEPFGAGASMGIACYPENGQTSAELVEAADKAMYRAKILSGNEACLAGVEDYFTR